MRPKYFFLVLFSFSFSFFPSIMYIPPIYLRFVRIVSEINSSVENIE